MMNKSDNLSPDTSDGDLNSKQFENNYDDDDNDEWLFRSVKMYVFCVSFYVSLVYWISGNFGF